jgi:hypothetical protein
MTRISWRNSWPSHWGSNADLRGVSACTIGYDNCIPLRQLRRSFSFATEGMGIMAYIPKNYARLEVGYREKALKLFPGSADAARVSLSIQTCVS